MHSASSDLYNPLCVGNQAVPPWEVSQETVYSMEATAAMTADPRGVEDQHGPNPATRSQDG